MFSKEASAAIDKTPFGRWGDAVAVVELAEWFIYGVAGNHSGNNPDATIAEDWAGSWDKCGLSVIEIYAEGDEVMEPLMAFPEIKTAVASVIENLMEKRVMREAVEAA